jgi:hypothetical protein
MHGGRESKYMNRNIVYPGSIPLDTDLLAVNRNAMIAIGYLAQLTLGTNAVVDGLPCIPTTPASMTVVIGPGSITTLSTVDTLAYGSLPADATDPLLKVGINIAATDFTLTAPNTSGQSVNFMIQAAFQEADLDPVVLPYYNAANPAQAYSGPSNSGAPQNTLRAQVVQLELKSGAPANAGSQQTPPIDNGWVGLYVITVSYGQSAVTGSDIAVLPTAPFLSWKLPSLRPGFGSGIQTIASSGTFIVPANVTQVEAEVWGGGCGSFASIGNLPSGGGCGGGYARKRITGLTPGQSIIVTVGSGGAGGVVGGAGAQPGQTSSFGPYVSATGGSLNYLATIASPQNGATPAGVGVGGDVNLMGSAGQAAVLNQGGLGGCAPMGGTQNSGTTGVAGVFPGGGAAGAGTGANSATAYNGAAGASGLVVVRW